MPGPQVSQAKQQLKIIIDEYLAPSDVERVLAACDYADMAHDGITRKSGEPYVLHPIAVASILAHMRLDTETLMAALLHDVIEDTEFSKEDISNTFSKTVAELVDGVTKLSHSSDKEFNKAASFRKILQATLQDPRVIIVKLADRYHNMTTLEALRPDKRARIAKETFEIFVPMARLVGMNEIADNLEHLCYQNLDLDMYNDVQAALQQTKSKRCEYQAIWEKKLSEILEKQNIQGRIKKKDNNIELLRHFVKNDIDLQELTHSHAFEIILQNIADCDRFAELMKESFKVLSFQDHIRQPLPGGNQSLMMRIKGEKTTLSLTIQTELMRKAARLGVVLGENAPQACRSAIQASMQNLNVLVDGECAKTTFSELLDYLHQEKIWVYTPQGHLHELPQGATAVDFAIQFQRDFVRVQATPEGGLSIEAHGPQVHVMGFEIHVLAIVNELYFRRLQTADTLNEGRRRLQAKMERLRAVKNEPVLAHPFELSDFGLRRRFSEPWHREVIATLTREVPQWFKGTSSVLLAKELDIVPIGTMAHEYMQSFQSQGVRLRDFQKAALEDWVQEYRGDLGIALTDTVGMRAFLEDFDLYFAKLFDGLRHDSGDPFAWGDQALAHYRKLRINPHTKRLVFSDGLNLDRALALWRYFAPHIQLGFGIGTNLTNDVGLTPLNIVMKLVRANGQPVAKISDTPGKTMCEDETYLAYLRQVFQIAEPPQNP